MPLHAKLSLSAYVISGERSANRPKQLWNGAFHVKTSQSTKNQLDPAKSENRPKFDIRPFCTKAFNYVSLKKLCRADEKINLLFHYCVFNFFPTYRIFEKLVQIRIRLILVVTKNLKKIHRPEAEILEHEVGNMEKVTVNQITLYACAKLSAR